MTHVSFEWHKDRKPYVFKGKAHHMSSHLYSTKEQNGVLQSIIFQFDIV